jgi:hypothetical protein
MYEMRFDIIDTKKMLYKHHKWANEAQYQISFSNVCILSDVRKNQLILVIFSYFYRTKIKKKGETEYIYLQVSLCPCSISSKFLVFFVGKRVYNIEYIQEDLDDVCMFSILALNINANITFSTKTVAFRELPVLIRFKNRTPV